MSRSNPNETLQSPATKFIEWVGSEGRFKYYDKEKKENVFIDLPVRFIPLDILSTVKGWNDADKKGYWSNEIRSTKTDTITLRSKDGVEFVGSYEQVKEKFSSKGADYVQSVYAAMKDGKELKIVNFQLKGSALGPFIEFCKGKKITEIGVLVKEAKPMKKGATKYFEPVYEVMEVSEATNKIAIDLDVELQTYLKAYLDKNKSNKEEVTVTDDQDNGLNQVQNTKSSSQPAATKEEFKSKDAFINSLTDEDEDLPF